MILIIIKWVFEMKGEINLIDSGEVDKKGDPIFYFHKGFQIPSGKSKIKLIIYEVY